VTYDRAGHGAGGRRDHHLSGGRRRPAWAACSKACPACRTAPVRAAGRRSRSLPIRCPPTAEHGRGLKIIDAVADNVRLTGGDGEGTTVHFEKVLDWVPGAAGQHLFSADTAS